MGQELLRLEGPEIAALIRTHAHIPTVPSDDERQCRLKQHLHGKLNSEQRDNLGRGVLAGKDVPQQERSIYRSEVPELLDLDQDRLTEFGLVRQIKLATRARIAKRHSAGEA